MGWAVKIGENKLGAVEHLKYLCTTVNNRNARSQETAQKIQRHCDPFTDVKIRQKVKDTEDTKMCLYKTDIKQL